MSEKTTQPMFSIIMPLYNHEKYVAQAIDSVLKQSFADWELIIVDDGSTDSSGKIADSYAARDSRVKVLHRPNAGVSAARNAARKLATGRWIAYLDSDDIYFPDALGNFAGHIAQNPEATFIHGYRHRLNDDGSVTELPGQFQESVTTARELFGRMYLSCLCVTYPIELFDLVGGYDERCRTSEDYDLYLRLSKHTKFYPLGKATGLRRRHDSNSSEQTGFSRSIQAAVLERFIDKFGGRELLDKQTINRRLGKIYYSAGRQYFKQRCYAQSITALKKAMTYRATIKASLLLVLANALIIFGRTDTKTVPVLD